MVLFFVINGICDLRSGGGDLSGGGRGDLSQIFNFNLIFIDFSMI